MVLSPIYQASKLEFSDMNRNRRLGLNPRSPCAGIAIGLLETPWTQVKKQAKLTQHWYLSHSKSQIFHFVKTEVTWLNTHSTTAHGRRKGGQEGLAPLDFEIIGKKLLFFQFRGVKTKFHHFWPPTGKIFGKISYCPPPLEKILPTPMQLH